MSTIPIPQGATIGESGEVTVPIPQGATIGDQEQAAPSQQAKTTFFSDPKPIYSNALANSITNPCAST
jgi:hypothetical protein